MGGEEKTQYGYLRPPEKPGNGGIKIDIVLGIHENQ